jgi:putative phage-type endonuclease
MTALRVGSDAWHAERRGLITSTDIPILLGLSPYRSEADLAAEKLGQQPPAQETPAMRIGKAMEDVVRTEYQRATGRKLRRVNGLRHHPTISWAATSLDFVVGRQIVEAKVSRSRRWEDGLPQDVEAQVAWEIGCSGYEGADVAALLGYDLQIFPVAPNPALFENLVAVADDFRRRLAAGGPFTADLAYLRNRYPADNGAEMVADAELAALVAELVSTRATRKALESQEEAAEAAIKTRMGEIAVLAGDGFRVTWRRTKDREETDWRSLADSMLRTLPETERPALVGLHTTVRPGFRPFRVVLKEEDQT